VDFEKKKNNITVSMAWRDESNIKGIRLQKNVAQEKERN